MISEGEEMKMVRCREMLICSTQCRTQDYKPEKCDHIISNQINEVEKEETVTYYSSSSHLSEF